MLTRFASPVSIGCCVFTSPSAGSNFFWQPQKTRVTARTAASLGTAPEQEKDFMDSPRLRQQDSVAPPRSDRPRSAAHTPAAPGGNRSARSENPSATRRREGRNSSPYLSL